MTQDVVAVRLRLAQIVAQAETDEAFRQRLAADPAAVLADNNIPDGAVAEFSRALDQQRTAGGSVRLDDDPIPCIHTKGCSDFTCISTTCGPTCYITIVVAAPDS